jgi:phage baseplate assembly protein V
MFFDEHERVAEKSRQSTYSTRVGIVADRKLDPVLGPVVRLQYPDKDTVNSAWVPVLQHGAQGMQFVRLPRLGERMLVAHMDQGQERGIALGGLYTAASGAPTDANIADQIYLKMDDGAIFTYDPGASKLAISGVKEVDLQNSQDVNVTTGGNVKLTVTGNVTLKASGTTDIEGATVTVKGPTTFSNLVTFDAGATVIGTITHTGNMNTTGVHTDSNGHHS